jgi:putative Mg2+ transporter-C (MgtC) family protein
MERELIAEFIDIAPRLLAATAAGIVIGVNRDMRGKGAGIRTLGLVALGSALAVVSVARFSPPALSGVLQGIITGVGFIGGGSILRDAKADEVPGLTTAATVWVTASIGIACGLGSWLPVFLDLSDPARCRFPVEHCLRPRVVAVFYRRIRPRSSRSEIGDALRGCKLVWIVCRGKRPALSGIRRLF